MENSIIPIIIAAGDDAGMESSLPKVMHRICGHPMIDYVVEAALKVSKRQPLVIVHKGTGVIEDHLGTRVSYVYQGKGLGTGNAVMDAQDHFKDLKGYILVLNGNIPLITSDTLRDLVDYCQKGSYDGVILTALLENAHGYGRIIRDISGDFERIVAYEDATEEERLIKEVDASVYCFYIPSLLDGLAQLNNKNGPSEHYLTHVLGHLKKNGKKVGLYTLYDSTEIMGIDNRLQQAKVQKIMGQRINLGHLKRGVTIIDPDNTYIGYHVEIERDVIIYPGNVLEGHTVIGEGSVLYPNNRILDSTIGKETQIQSSVILESRVGDGTTVGPFAYIRPGSDIAENVKIGDFVEVKNTKVGKGSKISHLAYVGDGDIGENVNIGCGVIFVNYDGKRKHRTIIEDNAFVGCNTNLVAPVRVKNNAYIAAGSTITQDVPEDALAIARARQTNKANWVKNHKRETEENQ